MISWADNLAENLWRAGLAVVPLAVVVAAVCRLTPMRPATRHSLWLLVLAWFVLPVVLPLPPVWNEWTVGVTESTPTDSAVTVESRPVVRVHEPDMKPTAPASRVEPAVLPPKALPAVAKPSAGVLARSAAPPSTPLPPTKETAGASARPLPTNQSSSIRHEPRRQGLLAPTAGSGGSSHASRPVATAPPRVASAAPRGSLTKPAALPDARKESPSTLSTTVNGATGQSARVAVQVSPVASVPAAPASNDATVAWYVPWINAANDARAALVQLPPLPAWLWLVGVAAVGCACLAATLRFALRLGRAQPAPREIQKAVATAAAEMGLRSVPRAYVVDARISPLVWCGWRPRLILPRRLWAELDNAGRSAVLCHELAHLKRRDHWVRWGELLICAAYWWHPLAWWVRRRVSEEAENCCDAWVTWLLPHERRAYAQALLRTNQFTTGSQHAAAPMGLGVLSGRAKRMARRLTMVMTHSTRPGLSGAGITLAVALAVAGWSSTPLWACPKKAKQTTSIATPVVECTTPAAACIDTPTPTASAVAPALLRTMWTPRPVRATLPMLFAGGGEGGGPAQRRLLTTRLRSASPFVAIAAGGGAAAGGDDELAERLEALEQDLARIAAQLAEVSAAVGRGAAPRGVRRTAPAARAAAEAHRALALAENEAAARAPQTYTRYEAALSEAHAAAADAQAAAADAATAAADADAEQAQAYRLSEGKLEALTELLKRDDVPLRVRPGDGQLEVLGPAAQQLRVEAFIGLLDDQLYWREYKLAPGKLEAFGELMARSDVPIFVQPQPESINIRATAGQQRVIEAFLREIDPELEAGEAKKEEGQDKSKDDGEDEEEAEDEETTRTPQADSPFGVTLGTPSLWQREGLEGLTLYGQRTPALTSVEVQPMLRLMHGVDAFARAPGADGDPSRQSALAYAEQLKQQAAALSAQADSVHAQHEQFMAQVQTRAEEVEAFKAHAQVFGEQAEKLEARVEALHEAGREPARQDAAAMRERAEGVAAQVEIMESQAAELTQQAEQLSEQVDGLREAAEALRATAEELIERFAEGGGK